MSEESELEKFGLPDIYKDFYFDKPISGMEAEKLLSAARLALLYNYPFFGKLALNLRFVEVDFLPTNAVDQRGHLFYNRNWVNHFEKKDAIWSMAHEVMHLVLRHIDRRPKAVVDYLWQLACDYVLETHLVDAGLEQSKHSLIKTTPAVQEMVHRLGTTPKVYKHLLEEAENHTNCEACKELIKKLREQGQKETKQQQAENEKINQGENFKGDSDSSGNEESDSSNNKCEKGSCSSNCKCSKEKKKHTCGLDGLGCCSGSLVDFKDLDPSEQQKWLERIIAAKQHAESKGNMPAGLGEYIDQLVKSKVRWQDYVKTAATKLFGRDRYTYKRVNRRGPALRMRLPGHVPDGLSAVTGIDTSNSMSVEEVKQCISEVAALIKTCGCSKLWLILHDCRVYFSGWVHEADLTKLKMARGGTSHIEVFDCLNRKHSNSEFNLPPGERIALAILFTDLGTTFPFDKPDFEVLWGVPSNGTPGMSAKIPFGKKIEVEINAD